MPNLLVLCQTVRVCVRSALTMKTFVAYNSPIANIGSTELCKSFLDKRVLDEKSGLHYLLPPSRIVHNHRLRHQTKFQPPKNRTAGLIKALLSTR